MPKVLIKKERKQDIMEVARSVTIPVSALNEIVETANEFLEAYPDVDIYNVFIRIGRPYSRTDGNIGIEFDVFDIVKQTIID